MKHKFASTTLLLSLIIFTATIQSSYAIVWSPIKRLPTDTRLNYSPSITQSDDGTIWAVWQSYNTTNFDIFCKNSSDNGQTWSPTTQLTSNSSEDKFPSITQAADGKLWVVWSSNRIMGYYDIFCKNSSDDGATWSPATLLASTFAKHDEHPSITRTADGKLWVVWASNTYGNFDIRYMTSSDNGTTWDLSMTTITSVYDDDVQPSIAGMLDGKPWVVWVRNDDLFYSVYEGPLWSSEERLTDTLSLDWHPSIIQLGNGEIWVVWDSRLNISMQSEVYYTSSSNDGGSWSSPIELTDNVLDDDMPSILQAGDGPVWLAWSRESVGGIDIYYRYSILGDVNGDGTIDIIDLGLFAEAYGLTSTSPTPNADINIDGVVDILDIGITSANWGQS